jgi:two-component system, sensor histidine kinase YesM
MGRLKFRTQLGLGFTLVIVFIILAMLFMLQFILRDSYRTQESSILKANSRQIAINIGNRLDYYMSYLQILSKDKRLLVSMETEPFTQVRNTLDEIVAEYMNLNVARLNAIRLYRNGIYAQTNGLGNIKDIFAQFVPGSEVYRNNYLITGTYLNNRNEKVFSIFQKVFQKNSDRDYFLEMCIYETEIFGFFNGDNSGNSIAVFAGDRLLSINDRKLFTHLLYGAQQDDQHVVNRDSLTPMANAIQIPASAKSGIEVVLQTSTAYIDRAYTAIIQRMLLVLAGVCALAFVMVQQISRRLNRRMKTLSEKIKDISSWKLEHRLSISGKDEFATLGVELDETRTRILALIAQENESNALKREAEISALRSQINSHFLFNSLSSIKWLSRLHRWDQLSDAVDKLAIFLRYSLSFKENMVPLKLELEHLNAYTHLQKLRFGDEVTVHLDIQDELMEAKTLKLLLQPLVENAIYHGRKEDGSPLHITIYSTSGDGYYQLVVEDDGNGMTADCIRNLMEDTQPEQGGFGLRNVIWRLRMCLLGKGGLSIESEPGISTRIVIRQPL